MSSKPVIARARATRDIKDAIGYYLADHAQEAALDFVDALQQAYALISEHPGVGGSRYAYELDLPGLRSRPMRRFPYLIFYVEENDHIDVWRVLHGRRHIPSSLQD